MRVTGALTPSVTAAVKDAVPVKLFDVDLPAPTKAPEIGQHTDEVLRDVLGYDDATIADKRAAGALG